MKITKPMLFLVLSVLLMNYKTVLASNSIPNINTESAITESAIFDEINSEYTVTGKFFGEYSYKVKLSSSKGKKVRPLDLVWFKIIIGLHPGMTELYTDRRAVNIYGKFKVMPSFKRIKEFESYHKADELSIIRNSIK